MDFNTIFDTTKRLLENDVIRLGVYFGSSILVATCIYFYKFKIKDDDRLMSITDLKKQAKRFRENNYSKNGARL